jgi:hypothetical protein
LKDPAPETTECGRKACRTASKYNGHIDPTGNRQIGAQPSSGALELKDLTASDFDGCPALNRLSIYTWLHVRSDDHHNQVDERAKRRPFRRRLQTRASLVVIKQEIGNSQRGPIYRTGIGDAIFLIPEPSEVLDGGQQSRPDDLESVYVMLLHTRATRSA